MDVYVPNRAQFDATTGLAAYRMFALKGARVELKLVRNWETWPGDEMQDGDLALALPRCGRSLTSGEDGAGNHLSLFEVVLALHGSPEDQENFGTLARCVGIHAASRDPAEALAATLELGGVPALGAATLRGAFMTLRPSLAPALVYRRIMELVDAMVTTRRANDRAQAEADKDRLTPDGLVAVVEGGGPDTPHELLRRGVLVVIVSADSGTSIMVNKLAAGFPLQDERIFDLIPAGERGEWELLWGGRMLTRGMPTRAARSRSEVNIEQLLSAVVAILREQPRAAAVTVSADSGGD